MNQLESHDQTNSYVYVQSYMNYLQPLATCLPKMTIKKIMKIINVFAFNELQ